MGIMQNVKQRTNITLNGWRNEHEKSWVFREMVKWMRWWLMLHGRQQWQLTRTPAVVFQRDRLSSTCQHQKHCWQWPGNHNDQSKLCKYHAVLRNLCLRHHEWYTTVDCGFRISLKWHVADIKIIASDDQLTLTITKFFKIYIYEIV